MTEINATIILSGFLARYPQRNMEHIYLTLKNIFIVLYLSKLPMKQYFNHGPLVFQLHHLYFSLHTFQYHLTTVRNIFLTVFSFRRPYHLYITSYFFSPLLLSFRSRKTAIPFPPHIPHIPTKPTDELDTQTSPTAPNLNDHRESQRTSDVRRLTPRRDARPSPPPRPSSLFRLTYPNPSASHTAPAPA